MLKKTFYIFVSGPITLYFAVYIKPNGNTEYKYYRYQKNISYQGLTRARCLWSFKYNTQYLCLKEEFVILKPP